MNIFTFAFREILYRPLLNLLVLFYQLPFVDFGSAILFLTLLIRILLWPLNSKMIKGQRESQIKSRQIQGRLKEVQKRYKDDMARQNEEVMKLWREMKFNPFASLAPMIIQMVILIAFYQVLRVIVQPEGLSLLYSFIPHLGKIYPSFLRIPLGILDLSQASKITLGGKALTILTGAVQYFYSKMSLSLQPKTPIKKKNRQLGGQQKQMQGLQKMMQGQMMYFLPIMTVFICWSLPAALSFYWFFSTLIGIFQQKMIFKRVSSKI